MPVSKKKPTTLTSGVSTQESSSPALPEQEDFRQYLRRLAVSAIQVLLEQVMREELEQCIGASWGECTPNRRGYRNGSYTRDLELIRKPGFWQRSIEHRQGEGKRGNSPLFSPNVPGADAND
jgi:hypothetical protein